MPEDTASQFVDARAHHCTSATFPSQVSSNQSSQSHPSLKVHGYRRPYRSKSQPRYSSSRPRQNNWLYSHATRIPSYLPPSETEKLCFVWYHTQHCTRQYAFPPAIRCPYRHGLEEVVEVAEPQPWQVKWHNPNCVRPLCPVAMGKKSAYGQIYEEEKSIQKDTTHSTVALENVRTSAHQQNEPPHERFTLGGRDHSAASCIDNSINFRGRAEKREVITPKWTPKIEKIRDSPRSEKTTGVGPSGPGDSVTALLEAALRQAPLPEISQFPNSNQVKTKIKPTCSEPFSGPLEDSSWSWQCPSFPKPSGHATAEGVHATIERILDLLPQPAHIPPAYQNTIKAEGDIASVELNKFILAPGKMVKRELTNGSGSPEWRSLPEENRVRRARIPFPNTSCDHASCQTLNSERSDKLDSGHLQKNDASFRAGVVPSKLSPMGEFREQTRPTRKRGRKRKRKGNHWKPGNGESAEKRKPDSPKNGKRSRRKRRRVSTNSKYPQDSTHAKVMEPAVQEEERETWLVKRKMYFTHSTGPRNGVPNHPFTVPAEASTVDRDHFQGKEGEGMEHRVTVPQKPSKCDDASNTSREPTFPGPNPTATAVSTKDLCGQGLSFHEAVKVLVKTAQSSSEQRAERDADFLKFAFEEIIFEKIPKPM